MAINGVGHNYDYFGTTTNYIRGKATVREAISKTVEPIMKLNVLIYTIKTGSVYI